MNEEKRFIYFGRNKADNSVPIISTSYYFNGDRMYLTFAFLNVEKKDKFNRKETHAIHKARAIEGNSVSFPIRGTKPTYKQTIGIALTLLNKSCTDGTNKIAEVNVPTWAKKTVKESLKALSE